MKFNPTYSDGELVSLLRQGDREAFENIYGIYWPLLYDIAYKRLASREQTEDVLQDVFARLWTRREVSEINNLGAYLASSVRYEVIHYINKSKNATRFYEPFEAILREMDSPEDQLLAKEMLELVYQYAETLPEKRKRIFLMHIKSKLTTKEIADELGVTQKTVQNQLGTALQGLKTHLSPVIIAIIVTRF